MDGTAAATQPSAGPDVEFAECTDPGRDPTKSVNEDAVGSAFVPAGFLGIVCDGMGGHVGGREASTTAVRTILEAMATSLPSGEALAQALTVANERVFALRPPKANPRPGSTVVALLVTPRGALVAHVGDSRIYWLHGDRIEQLTKDHTKVQQMVDAGLLTREDAATHPHANQIYRALGLRAEVDVEVSPSIARFSMGDVFVLCSDGLTDLVPQGDIQEIVRSSTTLDDAARSLVALANERGGHDNVSVLLVRPRTNASGGGTVVLTSREDVPAPPRSAPTETAVAAVPVSTPVLIPAPPPSGWQAEASARTRRTGSRRTGALLLGLLVLLVLGFSAFMLWLHFQGPGHKTPSFVESSAPVSS